MKKHTLWILLVALVVGAMFMVQPVRAQLIYSESFSTEDYGTSKVAINTKGWSSSSGLNYFDPDGGITHSQLGGTTGGAYLAERSAGSITSSRGTAAGGPSLDFSTLSAGDTIWFAVLFDYKTGAYDHYVTLNNSQTVNNLGVRISSAGSVIVFCSDNGGAAAAHATGLTAGSGTYLMLVRGTLGNAYDGSGVINSVIDFWFNPADTSSIPALGTPDWTTGADSKFGRASGSFSGITIMASYLGLIDEIRVGMTLDDVIGDEGVSVAVSDVSVASNAVPGTLVGTLTVVNTNATGFAYSLDSSGDYTYFDIPTGTTNLRTAVWMDAASYAISIIGTKGSFSVTNPFTIYVTADSDDYLAFEVTAEMRPAPVAGTELVGTLKANDRHSSAVGFSITGGREDLFTISGGTNLLQVAGTDPGPLGTIHYLEFTATNAVATNVMMVAVEVTTSQSSGTVFRFR